MSCSWAIDGLQLGCGRDAVGIRARIFPVSER